MPSAPVLGRLLISFLGHVAGRDGAAGQVRLAESCSYLNVEGATMPFVSSVTSGSPCSLLAYEVGTLTVVFIVFGVALGGYAIYRMIFKVGKD